MKEWIYNFLNNFSYFERENWIYSLSVALQMSAAIILLIGMFSKRQVVKEIENEEKVTGFGFGYQEDSGTLIVEKRGLPDVIKSSKYETMISNRLAAVFLFLGYLIGIWGENNKKIRLQETFISVFIFIGLCIFVVVYKKIRLGIIYKEKDSKKENI